MLPLEHCCMLTNSYYFSLFIIFLETVFDKIFSNSSLFIIVLGVPSDDARVSRIALYLCLRVVSSSFSFCLLGCFRNAAGFLVKTPINASSFDES